MDIHEKLKYFEPNLNVRQKSSRDIIASNIHKYVDGEEKSNEFGSYFLSRHVFPLDHKHGSVSLKSLFNVDTTLFSMIGKDPALENMDFRKTIFIDTETTGLAGGTGTLPFLIGLGFFDEDQFVVEQYFMRDYHEERAVLEDIMQYISGAQFLASYNGKCYDLNILSSRLILSRMKNPCPDLPHLDLLFSARRLWRRRLDDCCLTSIERHILGFSRQGDIPGFMIPSLYFEYLRTKDGRPLAPVFTHNTWDIVALAALSALLGSIFQDPEATFSHAEDWMSLGRIYDNQMHYQEAAYAYRKALDLFQPSDDREEAFTALGFALKRSGQWEKTVQVWSYMTEKLSFQVLPYEELAKYYEHRANDYEMGIGVVNRALERIRLLEELQGQHRFSEDKKDLEYRLRRLERKSKTNIE